MHEFTISHTKLLNLQGDYTILRTDTSKLCILIGEITTLTGKMTGLILDWPVFTCILAYEILVLHLNTVNFT